MSLLIVGLGNPGPKYETTRHNAGFITLDLLADEFGLSFAEQPKFQSHVAKGRILGEDCFLIKPQTFYNRVGDAVGAFARFYKIDYEDIIVIHDDIDTPALKVKTRMSGSHGGNNGMKSLISCLGTDAIKRIKIGVGRPTKPEEGTPADWVLRPFSDEDLEALGGNIYEDVILRLKGILEQAK